MLASLTIKGEKNWARAHLPRGRHIMSRHKHGETKKHMAKKQKAKERFAAEMEAYRRRMEEHLHPHPIEKGHDESLS